MRQLLLVAALVALSGCTAAGPGGQDQLADADDAAEAAAAPEPEAAEAPESEAAAEPDESARSRAEVIDEILSTPLEEGEYAEAVRCLAPQAYRSVRVLDDEHVLFEGPGDRAWLNRLRNRCVGLRPHATLRFRMRDSRLCELDTFEAVDTMLRGVDRVSATCSLGSFIPVTPEQVEVIRSAFERRR